MSKVDWITWKTDVTDIINPEKVIDSVRDIVYLDGKIDVISNRIIDVANKAKCLKQ